MNEVSQLADHASQQSDRWMFVAILIVFILMIVFMARWFVNDREKMSVRLTAITDRHIQMTEKISDVVANNTSALNSFKETVRDIKRT